MFVRWMLALAVLSSCLGRCVAQGGPPAPIQAGRVALTPENSRIQFVGTHVGDEPNPRIGHFQQFSGELQLSPDERRVSAIRLEIETPSLVTPIPELTNHLKSPDFFETREFPKAIFVSEDVSPTDANGALTIEGALTLLGQTHKVVLPGRMTMSDQGLVLYAKGSIDRGQYGMDLYQDRVENTVTIEVWVGNVPAVE